MAEKIPDIAGAPAARAIPKESGKAINATLTAAIKSFFQFSANPFMPFLGNASIKIGTDL